MEWDSTGAEALDSESLPIVEKGINLMRTEDEVESTLLALVLSFSVPACTDFPLVCTRILFWKFLCSVYSVYSVLSVINIF